MYTYSLFDNAICDVIEQSKSESGSYMLLVPEVLLHRYNYANVNIQTSHKYNVLFDVA